MKTIVIALAFSLFAGCALDFDPASTPDAILDDVTPSPGTSPSPSPAVSPPARPTPSTSPAYPYPPRNFNPSTLAVPTASLRLDAGDRCVFDTRAVTFSGTCGTTVRIAPIVQGDRVIVPLAAMLVPSSAALRISGDRAVIFAVFGDANVSGVIDAGAHGSADGPGVRCDASAVGRDGADGDDKDEIGGGGGGGASQGARGGAGSGAEGTTGSGGQPGMGAMALDVPLFGGCSGGNGGGRKSGGAEGGAGGGGGGAIQISSAKTLLVLGTLHAGGGGGAGASRAGGGGGGGSGGVIVLEASTLDIRGTLATNGGAGGGGGGKDDEGTAGADGIASMVAASGGAGGRTAGRGGAGAVLMLKGAPGLAGTPDGHDGAGGGGGGGDIGRVYLRGTSMCMASATAEISPPSHDCN